MLFFRKTIDKTYSKEYRLVERTGGGHCPYKPVLHGIKEHCNLTLSVFIKI